MADGPRVGRWLCRDPRVERFEPSIPIFGFEVHRYDLGEMYRRPKTSPLAEMIAITEGYEQVVGYDRQRLAPSLVIHPNSQL